MRNSRYNYRRPVNEGDEEVPGEADGKLLTNKVRETRTSVSRERKSYPASAGIRKTWKPLPATKNSYNDDLENIQKPEPHTTTKAYHPNESPPTHKPTNIYLEDPVTTKAQPSSNSSKKADLNLQFSETTPQPLRGNPPNPQKSDESRGLSQLKTERDKHKIQQKKSRERTVQGQREFQMSTTPERIKHNKSESSNPYKRQDAAQAAQKYYNSVERQRKLENRRNRNSAQKSQSKASQKFESGEKDRSNVNVASDPNLQNVNIDLFKKELQQQKQAKGPGLKKVKVPVFEEDFEEITQTIENGVVVEEFRRTIKSPAVKHQKNQEPGFNVVEDLNAKDFEERKGDGSNIQSRYIKTRNNEGLFADNANQVSTISAREVNTSQRSKPKPADLVKQTSQGPESDFLLEESQEVVMFQSDSKNTSINLSSMHHRMGSSSSKDHLDLQKGQPREDIKEASAPQISTTDLSKNFKRDSPGPKRDIITQNINKKDIEDSGSWNEEQVHSDENSESSSDLLQPNPMDIKKMVPYDQRKEFGDNPSPSNSNKKLNIMYDELEDSGSEGSGPINREDVNHLASIIEEEEEATEYQRSRSRSNTRSPSPAPNNFKAFTPADNARSKQNSIIEHPNEYKSDEISEKAKEAPKPKEAIKIEEPKKPESLQNYTQRAEKSQPPSKAPTANKRQDAKSIKSTRPGRQTREKSQTSKSKKRKDNEKYESQSVKNPAIVHDRQVDLQDYIQAPIPEQPEESVKLEAPSEDFQIDQEDDQKTKTVPKKKPDTEKTVMWGGPKPLKLLWSIISPLGSEKALDFCDFLTFYLIFSELTSTKKLVSKSLLNLLQKFQKTSGPSHNLPYFLWAFMNPDRAKNLKKRTMRDVIRTCSESKGKGRKWLLDGVEESVRQSEGDMEDTLRNLRLTFNYPGTKRAIISFAEGVCKVDARLAMSREVNAFVQGMLKEREVMQGVRFADPIQGIESVDQEVENEEVEQVQEVQEPNYSDFVPREPQMHDQVVQEKYYPPDPKIHKKQMKGVKSKDDIQISAHLPDKISRSHQNNIRSVNASQDKTPGRNTSSNHKLQINYDEDFDSHARISQHAFSEKPHAKLEGSKMTVLNLYDKKNSNMQRTYNARHYPDDYRNPDTRNINISQQSDELSKSLQYRKPISSPQTDILRKSTRNRPIKNNVFTLKKHEPRSAYIETFEKPRDRTPIAKNSVNFEDPVEEQHERSRSKDRTATRPKSTRKRDPIKRTPINPKAKSKKSASSRKSSKKKRSVRKKTVDSESEIGYKKNKGKQRKEEDDSSTSEDREVQQKIKSAKKTRGNKSKRSNRKPRYQDEEFDSQKVKERSKTQVKSKIENQYKSEEKDLDPKPKKKVLFQVDINMDSKIVRIAIHHGDNIDRIVEKFDNIFKLKTKQKTLLIQRLKDQYIEMMNKETEAYH